MEVGKTYTIKLNSGEELIAKVTEVHLGQGCVVVTNHIPSCACKGQAEFAP
jgi:hypothetical protein